MRTYHNFLTPEEDLSFKSYSLALKNLILRSLPLLSLAHFVLEHVRCMVYCNILCDYLRQKLMKTFFGEHLFNWYLEKTFFLGWFIGSEFARNYRFLPSPISKCCSLPSKLRCSVIFTKQVATLPKI